MAKRYSKQPIADEEAYQEKLEVTRGYFKPDMEVMEFGSGTGSTAIIHSPHVKHILAIDGSSKMTEIARGKADKENIRKIISIIILVLKTFNLTSTAHTFFIHFR